MGLHSVTSTQTLNPVHDRQPIREAPMTYLLSQSMHASTASSATQFVVISSLHSTRPATVAAPRPRFCIDQLHNTLPRAPPHTPALQTKRPPFDSIAWPRVGSGTGSSACVASVEGVVAMAVSLDRLASNRRRHEPVDVAASSTRSPTEAVAIFRPRLSTEHQAFHAKCKQTMILVLIDIAD